MTKTPHDALFKSVFQQPENAAEELQHVLSAEHVSAIDWSTLKLEPGSYVDEKLRTSTATCCSRRTRKPPASACSCTCCSSTSRRPSRGWRCGC